MEMKRYRQLYSLIRLVLLGLLVVSSLGSSAVFAAPPAAPAGRHPTTGATAAYPRTSATDGFPSKGSVMHHVPLTLLQSLLSTPRGRALLRGGLDAKTVASLEHRYGTTAPPWLKRVQANGKAHAHVPSRRAPLMLQAIGRVAVSVPADAVPDGQMIAAAFSQAPVFARASATRSAAHSEPAALSLGRAPVTAGAHLTIGLQHFGAGEAVSLRFDGRSWMRLVADAVGQAFASAVVPATAGGTHTITAAGIRSGRRATARVRVLGLRVSSGRAVPGDMVTVSGGGFAPGSVVSLALRPRHGAPLSLGLAGVDGFGMLLAHRVVIPPAAAVGPATLLARNSAGDLASTSLSIGVAPRHRGLAVVVAPSGYLAQPRAVAGGRRPVPVRTVAPAHAAGSTGAASARAADGALPLGFEVNRGQSDPAVRFLAHSGGATVFLTSGDVVLSLPASGLTLRLHARPTVHAATIVRLHLLGANPAPQIAGLDRLPGRVNYLIGRDSHHWIVNVPTYARVVYRGVYPGIDLIYHGSSDKNLSGGHVEYDYVVAPGANPRAIRLAAQGGSGLCLDAAGNLVLGHNGSNWVYQQRPLAYQVIGGVRRAVAVAYALHGRRMVGLTVGAYDARYPLVIDPVLLYSSYFGGTGNIDEAITGVAAGSDGSTYITGHTANVSFPTTSGAYQANHGSSKCSGCDYAFVSKINPGGTALVYSTYLGGTTSDDFANAMAVDSAGNAYIVGSTLSNDFPTTANALHTSRNAATAQGLSSAFVTKLNAQGSSLVYSTYLGDYRSNNVPDTTATSAANAIALDGSGNIYVTGQYSVYFEPPSGTTKLASGCDAANFGFSSAVFVTKLNPASSGTASRVYSNCLSGDSSQGGGATDSIGRGITVDSSGHAYVTGSTNSGNFPVTEVLVNQACNGGSDNCFTGTPAYNTQLESSPLQSNDAFLSELQPDGTALLYSTYIGGTNDDVGTAIALDGNNHAYITGYTSSSTSFPTTNGAYQAGYPNSQSAFVLKMDPNNATGGSASLIAGTYLGGSSAASMATALALDSSGNVYLTGNTQANNFPTQNPLSQGGSPGNAYQGRSLHGSQDAFVAELSSDLSSLSFSTYLGGTGSDSGTGIALDTAGNIYVAGTTASSDFPLASQHGGLPQTTAGDLFIARIGATPQVPSLATITPNQGPATGGNQVVITGQRIYFPPNTLPATSTLNLVNPSFALTFGNRPATNITVNPGNDTITCTVPATGNITAPTAVSVTLAISGTASNGLSYTYVPAPSVTGISPTLGPAAGGTSVTITGSNLAGATAVYFGSASVAPLSINPAGTQITATTPAGTPGTTVPVTVTTPGGSSTSTATFTYLGPPTISSITPSDGPLSPTTSIAINGSSFVVGQTTVSFGGQPGAVDEGTSNSTIINVVPPSTTVSGPVSVTVTTPGGQANGTFTYLPQPQITSLAPASGPLGGGTTVVITGSGLLTGTDPTSGLSVSFGSQQATVTGVTASGTVITVTAPQTTTTGTVDVQVTTPGGTSPLTPADQFTYLPGPTITGINPPGGPVSGTATVTISGTGFVPGSTTVTFDGQPSGPVRVSPDGTVISTTTSGGPAGPATVVVTTPGGSATDSSHFTFYAPPVIGGVRPNTGSPTGGTAVTITGTNFVQGYTSVFFGAQPAQSAQVLDQHTILATSPATTGAGMVDITVQSLGGLSAITAQDEFTYTTPGPCPGLPNAGGFDADLSGWHVHSDFAPFSGTVPNATITPPAAIQVPGGAIHLDCLNLDANNQLLPSIDLSGQLSSITYHGFTVTLAAGVTLGPVGLTIGLFSVNLPSQLVVAGSASTLNASNVLLLSDGSFGGVPTFSSASLSYRGFTVLVSGLSFAGNALSFGDVEFGLPRSLLPSGSSPITLTGAITVGLDAGISGTLTVLNPTLTEAGFTVGAASITLDSSGLNVNDAFLTLPASLTPPHGNPITLGGQLQITPAFTVTGSLSVNNATFSVAGFSVTGAITLDNSGLDAAAQLALPASLSPPGGNPITISGNLQITSDYHVFGSLSSGPISMSLAGFTASVGNIVLDRSGLAVTGASLSLPSLSPNVGQISIQGEVEISTDFSVSGTISLAPFTFQDDGFTVSVGSVTLSRSGLDISSAGVSLPAPFAGTQLTGSLHIGSDLNVTGTLSILNPQFSYAGFSVGADSISLSLDRTAGAGVSGVVRITNAHATLPGITNVTMTGNLTASFDSHGSLQISGQLVVSSTSGHLISLTYGSFSVNVTSLTLDNSGVSVDGVTFTLPNALSPGNTPLTLTGALHIGVVNGSFSITGYLDLPNVQVKVYGFTLSVSDIRLGNTGLSIGTATLDMNALLSQSGLRSLSISSLVILPDFTFTGGIVSINGSSTLTISYRGASLSLSNISIGSSGLSVGTVTLTLPAIFGGHGYSFSNLTISPSGGISGEYDGNLSFSLGDFSVSASSLTLSSSAGITIKSVSFSLPILDGPVSVGDLGYDGSQLTVGSQPLPTNFTIPDVTTGNPENPQGQKQACESQPSVDPTTGQRSQHMYLPLPPINAGGFSISGAGCLTLSSDTSGHTTYLIIGQGLVSLAKAGSLAASFEIGSPDATHPYIFHHATINVQVAGSGIPLDDTGLEINGIIGGFGITQATGGTPIYSVEVGVDIQTDDGGYVFQGNVHLSFATDGNFGIGGNGTFFRLLPIYGGFCVRVTLQPDYVCQDSLSGDPTYAAQATGLGLYAVLGSNLDVHINKDITFNLNARAHIWVDSDGPELAASAAVGFHVPTDAFYTFIPPCSFDFSGSAQVGKFYYRGGKVGGFKGEFAANVCDAFSFDESIFVDDSGNVHLGDVSGYTLIEGQNHDGYLLARLGDGSVHLTHIVAVASPSLLARSIHTAGPALSSRVSGLSGPWPRVMGGSSAAQVTRNWLAAASRQAPAAGLFANQATVTVAPGQTATLFTLLWQRGAPRYTLTAPDGTVYSPPHPGAGNRVYHATAGLPAGFVAGDAIYMPRPMAGLWRVTIDNLRGNEGYRLEVHGHVPAGTLRVTAPAAGQTLVAHPTVRLAGTLSGVTDPHANTVSLYYTTAPAVRIKGHVMPNYSGTLIATGVPVVGGSWAYTWDASALPGGTYYVYAVLDNGTGALVNGYAAGTVRVVQQARPDAPRNVVATEAGGQLSLVWTPPAQAAILAGYRLRYRTNTMPRGQYAVIDLGESQRYTLNETLRGARYTVEIADYDLAGHLSDWTPAQVVAQPSQNSQALGSDFTIVAGRGTVQAGGLARIPIVVRPVAGSRPTHGPADFVALSVDLSSLPAGVLARPSVDAANLFDPGTGRAAPLLRVYTNAALRPGVYPIRLIGRQIVGSLLRARTARALLVIRGGDPSRVTLSVGRTRQRADHLLEAPIVARVVDQSGSPVQDGHTLTFSSLEGTFTPSRVEIVKGTARTVVVWVAGTHPIVTADAGTTLARAYLGPAPRGASAARYFAASAGQAARAAGRNKPAVPATSEDLSLYNPLPAPATVRLHLFVQPRSGGPAVERVLTVPLSPRRRVVEYLATMAGDYPLIGVRIESDLPIVSRRIVNQTAAHGRTTVRGTTAGVAEPRASYRFTVDQSHGTIDLFNPGSKAVRITVRVGGKPAAETVLSLQPGASARVGALDLAVAAGLPRWTNAVTVRAGRPIVAEADPVLGSGLPTYKCAKPRGKGAVAQCTLKGATTSATDS